MLSEADLNPFNAKNFTLDRNDAVDANQINDDFICLICLNVVLNPVHCGNCQALFCKTCVRKWIGRASIKQCPKRCGNGKEFKESALNRLIKNQLDAIVFRCPSDTGCGKTFSYAEKHKHMGCSSKTGVTCLQNCGDKTLYKND